MDLKNFNVFQTAQKFSHKGFRNWFLDTALKVGIPFNMGKGLKIKELNNNECIVISKPKYNRKNHVGTVHAAMQALIVEFPAGLVVAQNYEFKKYRIILSNLNVTYHKPGVGILTGVCRAPSHWPDISAGEVFLEMTTKIHNEKNELIAEGKTTWQIKAWSKTKEVKKS